MPSVRQKMQERYTKTAIVVIPSSIHEMLFLPWDEEIDERYMDEMIQGVNDILVSTVEQLGNKSYIMEV